MIRARLVFWGKQAEHVARAIEPDNLPNMSLQIDADRLCLQFSTEKIGTLLSTVDDLLMNIKIAEETLILRGGEMKFHLEASFRLSADAAKAEAAISDFFSERRAHTAERRS